MFATIKGASFSIKEAWPEIIACFARDSFACNYFIKGLVIICRMDAACGCGHTQYILRLLAFAILSITFDLVVIEWQQGRGFCSGHVRAHLAIA